MTHFAIPSLISSESAFSCTSFPIKSIEPWLSLLKEEKFIQDFTRNFAQSKTHKTRPEVESYIYIYIYIYIYSKNTNRLH